MHRTGLHVPRNEGLEPMRLRDIVTGVLMGIAGIAFGLLVMLATRGLGQ